MKDVSQTLLQTSKLIYQISENIKSQFKMPFEFSDIQMKPNPSNIFNLGI
jgi:hypothetical protein